MMPTHRMPIAFVAALAVVSLPAVASAQPSDTQADAATRRPYRGLFGAQPDPQQPPALVLSASIYEAYDDDVYARDQEGTQRGSRLSPQQAAGVFTGAQLILEYMRNGDAGDLEASVGTHVRKHPEVDDLVSMFNSKVHASRSFGKTTMRAGHTLLYSPYYQGSLFPGPDGALPGVGALVDDPIGLDPDQSLFQQTSYRHAASVSIDRSLSRRTVVSALVDTRYVDFQKESALGSGPGKRDFWAYGGSARLTHRVTANAMLVLGYGYRTSTVTAGTPTARALHDIEAGVNYARALSFSRRTSVSFTSGSTIAAAEPATTTGVDGRTRLRLSGSAALQHEMGRTWVAALSFRRGANFHDGFGEPLFSDVLAAELNGLLSRRWEFSAVAQGARATFTRGTNAYEAVSASTQIRYALTRSLCAYVRYTYFQYDFDSGLALDSRFGGAGDRSGVRVGLSANLPLIR